MGRDPREELDAFLREAYELKLRRMVHTVMKRYLKRLGLDNIHDKREG